MPRLHALGEFIALDFETTGLIPGEDEVIDIGAVHVRNGEEVARFETLVDPGRELSQEISQLTGITNQQLSSAPRIDAVRNDFRAFLGNLPVMAHNARFEYAFLQQIFGTAYTPQMLDTYQVLTLMYPLAPSHSLEYYIRTFGLRSHELHRGLQDAIDMLEIIRIADSNLDSQDFAPLCGIVESRLVQAFSQDARKEWSWLPFFTDRHLTAPPSRRNFRDVYAESVRADLQWNLREAPLRLAEPAFFAEEYPHYQIREPQRIMAEHAADILTDGGVYVVEAGTGTGKTLAYSTAVLATLAADNGSPVVVSTHTKALQNQFLEREIPALKRLFGLPELHAVSLKGMNNYVCVRKLLELMPASDNLFDEGLTLADRFAAAFLEHWMYRTKEGELEEFPRPLLELPLIDNVRTQARADFRDCTRRECPYYHNCFYFKKEWEAESAHILAVNHSLLLSYPRTYPQFDRLVVDEADELYNEARDAFSSSVSYAGAREAIDHLAGTHGLLPRVLVTMRRVVEYMPGERHPIPEPDAPQRIAYRWNDVLDRLDAEMRLLNSGELFTLQIEITDQRVSPAVRERLLDDIGDLLVLCAEFQELCTATLNAAESAKLNDDALPDLRELRMRMDDITAMEQSLRLFSEQNVRSYALYFQIEKEHWAIVVAPYDIGSLFASRILGDLKGAIFTSATISSTPDMSDFVDSLGLDKTDKPVSTNRFTSPFDYRQNSQVVFLKGMPKHTSDQFPDKAAQFIADVAQKIGGRTLVLFTSKDRLKRTHELLMPKVREFGIEVISHGITNYSMTRCIDQFRYSDRGILMGARGMWKGVDIPGDALQCVIIEKMPYAVPNPYTRGLQGALIEQYRNNALDRGEYAEDNRLSAMAWNVVDKPLMFQAFRQMFGRLIRTETDKGVMVVLDPQLQGTGLSPRHRELMGLLPDVPYSVNFPNHALDAFDFLLPDPFEEMKKGKGK